MKWWHFPSYLKAFVLVLYGLCNWKCLGTTVVLNLDYKVEEYSFFLTARLCCSILMTIVEMVLCWGIKLRFEMLECLDSFNVFRPWILRNHLILAAVSYRDLKCFILLGGKFWFTPPFKAFEKLNQIKFIY